MFRIAALSALLVSTASAQALPDSPIVAVLRKSDPTLSEFAVVDRVSLTEELDLAIAIGTPKKWPLGKPRSDWFWWGKERKLGLFLQERQHPERVYNLAIAPGFSDCAARIERAAISDTVISCTGEKSDRQPHQKFLYDVRAKALVGQLSYEPFGVVKIFPNRSGVVFVANDTKRLIAVEFQPQRESPFRVLSESEAQPWTKGVPVDEATIGSDRQRHIYPRPEEIKPLKFGPSDAFTLQYIEPNDGFGPEPVIVETRGTRTLRHPVAKSTYDVFAAARPDAVKNGYSHDATKIGERIGPWQLESGKLWFGKTFYDSEGMTGVGGFGYFDPGQREFQIFSPLEVEQWSVSAIDVGPTDVWMALMHRGEWGNSSGGLLRFERDSKIAQSLPLRDIGSQFLRIGGRILLATDFGIASVENGQITRYFIDRMSDGRLRIATATH